MDGLLLPLCALDQESDLHAVVERQLREDGRHVAFYGGDAEVQVGGDRGDRLALRDRLRDLAVAA